MNCKFATSALAYPRLASFAMADIPSILLLAVGSVIIATCVLLLLCSLVAGCIALFFSDPPAPISRNHALIRRMVLLFKWAFGIVSLITSSILGYVIGASFDQVKTLDDFTEAMRQLVDIPVDLFMCAGYFWCAILIFDLIRLAVNGDLRIAYNRFFERVFFASDVFRDLDNKAPHPREDETPHPPEWEDWVFKSVRWFLEFTIEYKKTFILFFGVMLWATWYLVFGHYGSMAIKSFLYVCLGL